MSEAALETLEALVLESGKHWGEVAADFQHADAEAIFSPEKPHWHFITRPRGGSKSTDIAGVALAWLVNDARPLANGHVVASSSDQAAIIIDAAAGFVSRTPELQNLVAVENERIIGPNGAWLRVLPLDGSSSWGLRDAHLLICDEFAQWPETRKALRVWKAVLSTTQKVPGCRLIILTSAGEPSHFSHGVIKKAREDTASWRVSEAPGPVPWVDQADLEAQRPFLTDAEFDRLHLNIWAEDEDRAIREHDLDMAAVLTGPLEPQPQIRYLLTLDVGVYADATVAVIAHTEPMTEDRRGPRRVVVDRLHRWQGSRRSPVQLDEVEHWVAEMARRYNRAEVHADPDQAVGILQHLNAQGVRAQAFDFNSASVGRIASSLILAFRNGQIQIPKDKALRNELLRVRVRESSPGVIRLDHDRGGHDDQAVAIGMAAHLLLGRNQSQGQAFLELWRRQIAERQARDEGHDGRTPSQIALEQDNERRRRMAAREARLAPMRRKVALAACDHRWRRLNDKSYCVWCQVDRAEYEAQA